MDIEVIYSLNLEIDRIRYTLNKINWYVSEGYAPHFPNGTSLTDSEDKIISTLKEEYKDEEYLIIASQLKKDFLVYEEMFNSTIIRIFGKNIPSSFQVTLTKYGVGGSYYPPNKVIYNLNNKKGIKTIFHEIIHLIIEQYVQKYKLSHWEKERTVDLILNSEEFSFLKYNSWQKGYHEVDKYIDPLFKKTFFISPEDFFSKVKDMRK